MTRSWAAQIRLRHWAHFLLLPLAGVDPTLPLGVTLVALVRGGAIAFTVLAFGYLLNSLSDRHMDLDPDKRDLVPGHRAGVQRVAVMTLVVGALALGASGPASTLLATASCLVSGWVYSAGPRLKALPLIGSALNVGNFAPLLAVGLAHDEAPPGLGALVQWFALLLLQNQLIHEAADAEEDARGGVQTTFRRIGRRGAALLALACGLFLVISVGSTEIAAGGPWVAIVIAPPFLFAFPYVLHAHGQRAGSMRRLRLAHRAAAFVTGALLYGWSLIG